MAASQEAILVSQEAISDIYGGLMYTYMAVLQEVILYVYGSFGHYVYIWQFRKRPF